MKKKGFTLVELLTIIVVLGLIISIAVPVTSKILRNAEENKFITDSRTILKGIETYITENNIKIPDEGLAIETLELDFNNLNNYTGIVKEENGELILDPITNNTHCGSGNTKNFKVHSDMTECLSE